MEDQSLKKKYKHIFSDMDGTLTQSRSAIREDLTHIIQHSLSHGFTFAIISGASRQQIEKQIPLVVKNLKNLWVMGQSGCDTMTESVSLWNVSLTKPQIQQIDAHMRLVLKSLGKVDSTDLIEYRGGQVSLSLVGHNAGKGVKRAFDPKGDVRRNILDTIPFKSDDLMVRIGGTTCLDYTYSGWGKQGNIKRLIEHMGWNKDECVYIGDQLYKGGNDEDMIGYIDTIQVDSPEQTYKVVNTLIHYGKD